MIKLLGKKMFLTFYNDTKLTKTKLNLIIHIFINLLCLHVLNSFKRECCEIKDGKTSTRVENKLNRENKQPSTRLN